MEKRYIDLIHELSDSETLRLQAIAERDTLKGELREAVADHIEAVKNTDEARRWVDELEAERDAARAEAAELRDKLDATRAELRKVGDQGVSARLDRAEAREEAAALREQVARLRLHLGVLLDYTDEESYSNVPRREVNDAQDAWDETRPTDNSSHVAP